jgi:hypothetical protein
MNRIEIYFRIAVSVTVVLFLLSSKRSSSDDANAVYVGFLFADFITWIVAVVVELPDYTRESLIELVVMLLMMGVLNGLYSLERPHGSEAEAISFLVFMGVMSLKLGWFTLKRIDDDLKST